MESPSLTPSRVRPVLGAIRRVRPRRHRPGKPTLTASAGLLPAMVDLAVTGVPTEGIAVGGLSALAVGVAAVAI
ncbi:hypothetical protein GS439_02035 [Rhodococcus hoagii]|uniref:hypothetical protein n=1 Tax=Rhodococcus hoagii TaxID=43767 RepID=UPI0012F75A0C|nr:hypothetical protein [Prescottella equi]NKS30741.1 hypothetical protein [Prescottella equi]NKZ69566.1 hypothetical protein [Prescottella equi]